MNVFVRGTVIIAIAVVFSGIFLFAQMPSDQVKTNGRLLALYPHTQERPVDIPSPVVADDGRELICAITSDQRATWVHVSAGNWETGPVNYFGRYAMTVDREDFPSLARTGLHEEAELARTRTINSRPLAEIDESARPGRLSSAGFIAEDEDILSVLRGDNRLVMKLGLTHPKLARPLVQLWNLILEEQKHSQGTWNGKSHAWVHFDHFIYNGKKIFYEAHFTKGGQKSPFADGIEGAAHVRVWREVAADEKQFLNRCHMQSAPESRAAMLRALSQMTSGEMEPFYIARYGFYEGHTAWRTDPIAIAFIFGLRSLREIETAFAGGLDDALNAHFHRND